MPESSEAIDALEMRRKKARFRAWHRGMREMDMILGNFADDALSTMTEAELAEFERMLELPDSEMLQWFTGAAPVPANHDTELFRRISDHRRYDRT